MQKLTVSLADYSEIDNAKIAYFDGDFDGGAKDDITELQEAVDSCEAGSTLILDFSKLNYLNSFAIGQLVAWHNTIKERHGKVLIVGTNKNVEDIFTVLGINTIFKTFSTLEELKAALA